MPAADDALRRIDALIGVAMRLATSAPSGRVALAKLGELLAPEWIPRPWGDQIWTELEAARKAACVPLPAQEVERALRSAWGGKPTDELDELDLSEPVAVTPTSQVHRGVLDGEPVAVKVLRPGLAGSVRQDLHLLEGLLGPLGAAFPQLETQAVLRELRERVLDELDLEHEASSQRRFHRALRSHPGLFVPQPFTRLAGDSVHVSAWVEGVPFASAKDPDAAAARLVLFVLGGLREGIVHADPDPADLRMLDDGRLAVLDFGAVRAVEPARADAAVAVVEGFMGGDGERIGAGLQALGTLPAVHGPAVLDLAAHVLGELGVLAPSRLDVATVVAAARRGARRPDLLELILAGSLPPQDLWPARGVAQLFGAIARRGASGPWPELVLRALRDGWKAELP